MVTVGQIRELALSLPRTEEALVRDRVKFRVRGLVYLALSRDETELGFAYPKLERDALIESEPDLFFMPIPSDERFNWVRAHLAVLEPDRMAELVIDAWRMVVPKGVAAAYLAGHRSTSLD
ncbi:MAG TPA: MmcQ/YjbR family DNA-binding protein [Actinokineospora sp.]|jgi:hypothetical protein|nr:MmcQ/YjbR family DNA-binding protein [Actinokineospora sp.]